MDTLSFQHEVTGDDGDDVTVTVEAKYRAYVDRHYGEDADGNRGSRAAFVEDLTVKVTDENGVDITDNLKENFPEEYADIVEAAEDDAAALALEEDV